ncbi:MAG: protein kinase [Candidatus Solibacter sp.]|nr:protein kinase [Candidatus Solibacter sp.]
MMPAHTDLPAWKPDLRSSVLVGGRFQLLDEVGQGATSVVYKARDTAANRVVALKVLKGSAAQHPRLYEGFRREAEVGERIVHPNVIRIYQAGVHEGWFYLAMEYLSGRTLAEMLAMSPMLALAECEPLFGQLLAALDCIHGHGIVHRDVKPSNIMMTQDGAWKLMDFGISRQLGAEATVGPSLGTPEYMSPEQLMGKAAGPASDIYAAGAVFYEALAGQVPFRTWQPVQRCTQPPPRVIDSRPEVPPWLDQMIARALAPNPAGRYPDVASMIREIGSFAPAAPARPAPPPPVVPVPPPPNSQSLASLLKDEPADLKDVLALMAEALMRLQFLASSGESHEPLTPHTLRLSAFGRIEISAHGPTGERDTLMVSSPKYTPPELLRGHAPSAPSARVQADLYVLGFVMYEFLLGRTRFRGEFPNLDERGTDLGWMEWHSDTGRKPRPAADLLPGIPAALSQLMERMLVKDPARRCATYEEALAAIQDLTNRTRQTQQVRLPGASPAPPRQGGLNTVAAAVAVAVILICLVALAIRLLR